MFFLQTVRKKKYTLGAKWGRELQGKNSFVTATNLWTKKKIAPATKNFAAATKRFVDRTKHFVVVTISFCYPYFNK